MLIKLIIDSPTLGRREKIIDVQSNISEEDIKALYMLHFGVSNLHCSWEKLKEDNQDGK